MRFYEVNDGRSRTQTFATLDDARSEVRCRKGLVDFRDVTVDEVEVPLDKDNVLRLLRDEGGTHAYLRQWGMTPRGGIKLQEREE